MPLCFVLSLLSSNFIRFAFPTLTCCCISQNTFAVSRYTDTQSPNSTVSLSSPSSSSSLSSNFIHFFLFHSHLLLHQPKHLRRFKVHRYTITKQHMPLCFVLSLLSSNFIHFIFSTLTCCCISQNTFAVSRYTDTRSPSSTGLLVFFFAPWTTAAALRIPGSFIAVCSAFIASSSCDSSKEELTGKRMKKYEFANSICVKFATKCKYFEHPKKSSIVHVCGWKMGREKEMQKENRFGIHGNVCVCVCVCVVL